jgi:hypothetical protein
MSARPSTLSPRGHVARGADGHAARGHDARIVGDLGDTEVEDLGPILTQQDHVRRLDVAVNDADLVRGREPVEDRRGDFERGRRGKAAHTPHALRQGLAFEPLHDEERHAARGRARVRDGHDVRVLEATERAPLVAQPLDEILATRELAQQRLEHEALAELQVLDVVDGTHSPHADPAEHAIACALDLLAVFEFAVVRHARSHRFRWLVASRMRRTEIARAYLRQLDSSRSPRPIDVIEIETRRFESLRSLLARPPRALQSPIQPARAASQRLVE